jgi:hypothetical protein
MFRTFNKSILVLVLALSPSSSSVFAADREAPRQPHTVHVFTVGVARAGVNKKEALLPGADRNAVRVAAFFKSQQGLLAEEVRTTTLTNDEATHDAILGGLECLEDAMQPGDLAIIHISAHGSADKDGEWRLAAYDYAWNGRSKAGLVSATELRDRLAKLPGKVILILDSCESGAFGEGVANRLDTDEAGLVVFVAALRDQYGYYLSFAKQAGATLPIGPSISGEVVQDAYGLFTVALLEALSGKADADGDGVVTLTEVGEYVSARVAGWTNFTEDDRKVMAARGVPAVQQTPSLRKPATISDDTPLAVVRHVATR